MTYRPTRIFALSLLAGSLLGWLSAGVSSVEASPYDYYVWVHPGGTLNSGSSTDDYLNCGYHAICEGTANSGTGLDWANTHGENVYYRANSSNSAGYSWSGTAKITEEITDGGECYYTYVSQYKRSEGHNSTVAYIHTGTNYEEDEFVIYGGYYPAWTSQIVGQTIAEDTEICDTTGAHLHQSTDYGGNHWKNTSGYYPEMSSCRSSCGNKDVMNNYQLGYYWSE